MALPKVGSKAPAFSLTDQNGKTVALKDFAGKTVVLYFYPKAMTPGCTVQACGLRDTQSELASKGAVAIGISPDSPARLKKFETKESLNFTLLGDEDHAVAEKYGVWALKKFMGRESMGILRTTFIIDTQGKIAHVMAKVNTKSHHEDVMALLSE